MQTLFLDSFDHYTALTDKYDTVDSGMSIVSGPIVLSGTQSVEFIKQGINKEFKRNLGDNYQTVVAGCAVYLATEYSTGGNLNFGLIRFNEGVNPQLRVKVNNSGKIEVWTGGISTGTLHATGTTTVPLNTRVFLELRGYIHGSSGEFEVWLDGNLEVSGTGRDTHSGGGVYVNNVEFANNYGALSYMDSAYIRGAVGLEAGGNFGNSMVLRYLTNGAGSNTAFNLTGAASNWQAVGEEPPNGDTSHVSSNSAGNRDSYNFDDGSESTIHSAQIALVARTAGGGTIKPLVKSGATTQVGAAQTLTTSYFTKVQCYDTDPNTASAWTLANLNAAEFGEEDGGGGEIRVTQAVVEVLAPYSTGTASLDLTNLMAQVVFWAPDGAPPPNPPILACYPDDLAAGTVFQVTIPGLRLGEQYEARAWAVNRFGIEGEVFGPVPFTSTTWTTAPNAPASISVSQGMGAVVNVSWTAVTSAEVLYYELERDGGAGFSAVFTGLSTSHSDATVSYGTAYTYRVRALDRSHNPSSWRTSSQITPSSNIGSGDLSSGAVTDSYRDELATDTSLTSTWTTVASLTFTLPAALQSVYASGDVIFSNGSGTDTFTAEMRVMRDGVRISPTSSGTLDPNEIQTIHAARTETTSTLTPGASATYELQARVTAGTMTPGAKAESALEITVTKA